MVNRRVRLLEAARRRVSSITTMSLAEIQANRQSRLPAPPALEGMVRRLGEAIFGTPRATVDISTRTVPGVDGDLPLRVYHPRGATGRLPLLIHLHGGGWVLGSPQQYDWLNTSLAEDAGVVVASVDYRKAPEHPAPTPVDDAIAASRWLAEHADEVGARGPVAVGGDSAGGNLSALVAVAARDAGWDLAAQVLIYPATDLTCSFPSMRTLTDEPILPRADIDAFLDHYLTSDVKASDPHLSPWFVDDLAGLAPALVQTAERDPLKDEGRAYAERLRDAGVPSRWTEYRDVPHGFVSLPGACPVADQAVAEITQFLRRYLHDETTGPRPA